jgi:hypothetical protein
MVERDKSKRWIDDEAYFKDQCDIGKSYEKRVAQRLIEAGVENVLHEDAGFRKSRGEIAKFTKTSGDLKIKGWPFEVKSRTESFMTPEDWRYWPMFVDTVTSFDKKLVQPRGYIFISQITGALMGVSTTHKDKWTVVKKWDSKRRITENFYCVDKLYVVSEDKLIDGLKKLEENKPS